MRLKKVSGTTMYRRIAIDIAERITEGEFSPGTELPSENDLAQEYDASRDTIRDAMTELRSMGIINSERGRRSQVRAATPQGEIAVTGPVRIAARMPTFPEREQHDVPDGVPMLVIQAGEDTVVVPADAFVICPQPSGSATKPKVAVPERQPRARRGVRQP
ncbi:GntR family transcriptional regulator [Dactylosporangium sp. CA-139066]|uniref:GntR family transcriptional regulator n=1 Tax=Dactylosporangium sp. CA-139066 TaxID=3239930 RepID=UPI003D921284